MTILVPTNRRPITPGRVLREDFLEPLKLTQGDAAEALGVDRTSLNELLNGRRNVTTEMALRLGHAFGTSEQYWINLQVALDLFDARQSEVAAEIKRRPVLVSKRQVTKLATKPMNNVGKVKVFSIDRAASVDFVQPRQKGGRAAKDNRPPLKRR